MDPVSKTVKALGCQKLTLKKIFDLDIFSKGGGGDLSLEFFRHFLQLGVPQSKTFLTQF